MPLDHPKKNMALEYSLIFIEKVVDFRLLIGL